MNLKSTVILLILAAPAGAAQTFNWTGATDGDWEIPGNWTTNGVVADVSVPVTGDTAIIDFGSVDINSNNNQSDIDLAALIIGPKYTGTVGVSSANALLVGAAKCIVAGGGNTQYMGTGGTYNWDVFICVKVGPNGTGDLYISGTIPIAVLHKGDVYLTSGTVTSLYMDATGGISTVLDLTVTTAAVTTLYGMAGDAVFSAGTITTTHWSKGALDVNGGTFTTVNVWGGTVDWATTGTLTTLAVYGGKFDGSGDVQPKTITNATLFEGGYINLDNGVGNITVTNKTKTYGGTFIPADGQFLDITSS